VGADTVIGMDRSPLSADVERISQRKLDHLELAVSPLGRSTVDAGWDDVHLVPTAVPSADLAGVDLSTELFGHRLAAPLVIVPMTGGHDDAGDLNAILGEVAQILGLAVGVGSQRAALHAPSLAPSFAAVRRAAPDAFVFANLGACQLVGQGDEPAVTVADVCRAIEMVDATAVTVHLNVVQELIQTEGDRATGAVLDALGAVVAAVGVPVVVKETGAGMTRTDAARLASVGVAALDVGGAGGTSFARIEAARAERVGDARGVRLGHVFGDWGLPTASSLLEVRGVGLPVIATGGVRHGLDAARALALGASAVGIGRLAIEAARGGVPALVELLEGLLEELAMAMVLTGANEAADLAAPTPVLSGFTLEWARQRGLLGLSG